MTKVNIFVALDALSFPDAVRLVHQVGYTNGRVGYKVNDLLYDRGIFQLAEVMEDLRAPLFVDAKLHDIPNTVRNSARRITAQFDPQFLTVHASGGREMVKAARLGAGDASMTRPYILAVTILTSLGHDEVESIYTLRTDTAVLSLAKEIEGEADGFVCSGVDLERLEGDSTGLRVVPGIRPEWYSAEDDQKRVVTPTEAVKNGATHLVIGRPIVRAEDPAEAVRRTVEEIDWAWEVEEKGICCEPE